MYHPHVNGHDNENIDNTEYYDMLGISRDANEDEIKRAYKKLALKYHPDRNMNNPDKEVMAEKYKQMSEAHEVLSEPQKKKIYDKFGKDGLENMNNENHANPFDLFNHMMNNNGVNSRNNKVKKMEPIVVTAEIELENLNSDTEVDISFNKYILFDKKNNVEDNTGISGCMHCDCNGFIVKNVMLNANMFSQEKHMCKECEGNGYKLHEDYEIILQNVEKKIIIPYGAYDDYVINNMIGEGHFNASEPETKGDVYVNVKVINNSQFERRGNNLIYVVNIDVFESLTGCEFEIKLLDGTIAKIIVNDIIENDTIRKIKGYGMRELKSKKQGDLYIMFNVYHPKVLNYDEQLLLKKIQQKPLLQNEKIILQKKLLDSDYGDGDIEKQNINLYDMETIDNVCADVISKIDKDIPKQHINLFIEKLLQHFVTSDIKNNDNQKITNENENENCLFDLTYEQSFTLDELDDESEDENEKININNEKYTDDIPHGVQCANQ